MDQRQLPTTETWLKCTTLEEAASAIETMVVRGAPAIGCAAAFALVLDARASTAKSWDAYGASYAQGLKRLAATRPTAVNLFYALAAMESAAGALRADTPQDEVTRVLAARAEALFADDLATCQAIGAAGCTHLQGAGTPARPLRVLTHCNTGSLATAGYGTALGVIRALFAAGRLERVYVDETRPWLQGARLTAYELQKEGIPHTLIVDGAAAHLMQQGAIDCAIVGADRIAANGDTANKIGTYHVAVACHYHGLPFYVAAPCATVDLTLPNGQGIPIELRPSTEVTALAGKATAPAGVEAYNPSFDMTPGALIAGIITEHGVASSPFGSRLAALVAQASTAG